MRRSELLCLGGKFIMVALVLGAGGSQGCMYYCQSLANAGVYRHRPTSSGNPVVEAYASNDGLQLSIKYRLEVVGNENHPRYERWANIGRDMVIGAATNPSAVNSMPRERRPPEDQQDYFLVTPEPVIEKSAAWKISEMRPLSVYRMTKPDNMPADSAHLGVYDARYVYFVAKPTESRTDIVVRSSLPARKYRTFWGYMAQGLMPFAFIWDIVTGPIQLAGDLTPIPK